MNWPIYRKSLQVCSVPWGSRNEDLWEFAGGNFLHGRMPCINSIKNTEGRRNANITIIRLLTAKAAPRRIIFERRVTYIQFQFPLSDYFYCMAYGTWTTSDFRFRTFVKEKLLNIQLMRTNYVLQHIRVHADSEYYHVCVGGGRPYNGDEFIGNKQIYLLTNKQTNT